MYKVRDREWGHVVALKALRRAQSWSLLRFKSEFRAIQNIRHDNLIQLHELVGGDGAWYFTMEYVDGLNLADWLGKPPASETVDTMTLPGVVTWDDEPLQPAAPVPGAGPLRPAEALHDVFAQVACGLQALHAASMVHRDLKPPNVMVDRSGRVKLLDFGLTELLSDPHSSLDARGIAGTPGYMAPEVRRGEAITAAADWYSFGAMLHQALWGTLPVGAPTGEAPDPSYAPLAQLCAVLCDPDPARRPSGAAVLAALQQAPAEAPSPQPARALVGRRAQLDRLESLFQVARASGPVVVLLMGESGVGKTALAHRFLTDAHQRSGALVLSGRCYEEMSVPLRALDAIVDSLAQRLHHMAEPQVRALLPRFIDELAQLFPVLGWLAELSGRPQRSLPRDPKEVRFRAFVALRDLLGRLADTRPMIVFLDDLQWGDAASASALVDLLIAPDAPPLLLVGTCRSEEAAEAAFVEAIAPLTDRSWGHHLAVPPLSAEESQKMAALLLDDDTIRADALVREAAGNPMFVELLVQWGRAARGTEAPATLQHALRARIAELEAPQRELLELVAVAGQPTPQRLLLAAGTQGSIADFAALKSQRLIRTRSVDQQPGAVSYHDRIRETALAGMAPERRQALNVAIADAMLSTGWGGPGQVALRLAAGGEAARAHEHAVTAADRAFEALQFDRAARFYELALSSLAPADPKRERLAARCAEALIQLGRAAAAAPLCEEVARHRGQDRDWQRMAAEQWISSGQTARGVAQMRALLEADGFRWPRSGNHLGLHILLSILSLRLRDWNVPAEEPAAVPEDSQRRIALCWSACRALISTDALRGLYYLAQGVGLALRARDTRRFARFGLLFYANIAYQRLRWGEDRFARCEAIAEDLADPYLLALAASQRGYIHHNTGRQPEAVEKYRESVHIFEEDCRGVGWESTGARSNCFNAMMWVGDLESMWDFIEEGRARAEHLNDWMARCAASLYGSFVEMARDQTDRVQASLEQAIGIASQEGFATWDILATFHALRFALYTGAPDWDGAEALWARIRAENLHVVPAVANQALDLRAATGLRTLARPAPPAGLERTLRRIIRRLDRDPRPDMKALAQQHGASLATIHGQPDAAADGFEAAAAAFATIGLKLRAAMCDARARQLRAGDPDGGHAALRDLGVAAPATFLDTYAPVASQALRRSG